MFTSSKPYLKVIKVFTLLLFLICSKNIFGQSFLLKAQDYIELLKNKVSENTGNNFKEYFISDIDHNGTFEIIERVNKIEEDAPGLLNSELSVAFDYDKIYTYETGNFVENNSNYGWYQFKQREHYILWEKLINKPELLSSDSKKLIKANKTLFVQEINRLKKLTE